MIDSPDIGGNGHCNMCDGNLVSGYIYIFMYIVNFLWPLINVCIKNMVVVFASICSVSMPNFKSEILLEILILVILTV